MRITPAEQQLAKDLGRNLRAIREARGWSLAQVNDRSGGLHKAAVVGTYERGDRQVSFPRLLTLAEFYGVALVDLLPASAFGDPRAVAEQRALVELGAEVRRLTAGVFPADVESRPAA